MSTKPLPMLELRDQIAKAIADSLGHGMREKCEKQADAVLAVVIPQLTATAEHAIAHLSAQAKVRVTDEYGEAVTQKLDKALGEISNAMEDVETGKPAAAILSFLREAHEYMRSAREDVEGIESFAARLSQGAQGEAAAWQVREASTKYKATFNYELHAKNTARNMAEDGYEPTFHPLYEHPAERAAVPDAGEFVTIPMQAAQAILNALDEACDGLRAASIDRQPTKLGRDRQADRLGTVRGARHIFEIAMGWKDRNAAAPQPPEGARVVDGWHERERLALRHLKEALHGFEVEVVHAPLMPPATYLEKVTLSCEFQPGRGHIVADNLRTLLADDVQPRASK